MKKRKIKLVGRLIRHFFEGEAVGRKMRGSPKGRYLDDLLMVMGVETYQELKQDSSKKIFLVVSTRSSL